MSYTVFMRCRNSKPAEAWRLTYRASIRAKGPVSGARREKLQQ